MIEFINSNFFTSLITFIAGVVAFVVYFKQRNDKKERCCKCFAVRN